MKKIFIPIISLFILASCESPKYKIGVFEGNGGAVSCIRETVSAINIDSDMEAILIHTSDIANGILEEIDAIVIPGGGGSRQFLNLGAENHKRIIDFIQNGGGALGICAGAYLFSDTPEYASIKINGAKAIDIEHDNRGHGMSKFTLSAIGKDLFPELAKKDTCFVIYYEGPVFVKNDNSDIEYSTFATMESDVHEEGNAPANMTNNKPFFIGNELGEGRVFSSIAHPEATPGMAWMVPRMLRWTLRLPYKEYSKEAITAAIRPFEILMNIEDLRYEASLFKTFLYGSAEEKVLALDWLESHYSWDAKSWIQGLLFDASPAVRSRTAKYIANMQYLPFLNDLKVAYSVEQDSETKKVMRKAIKYLDKI